MQNSGFFLFLNIFFLFYLKKKKIINKSFLNEKKYLKQKKKNQEIFKNKMKI